jgi:hypothetical protein
MFAGSIGAQSLSELAKKEKERRKKNQEKGEQALVITEAELQQGKSESTAPVESSDESTSRPTSTRATSPDRSGSTPPQRSTTDESDDEPPPTEIPRSAPLRDKIAIFEQMLTAYRQKVQEIDAEIAKNDTRIQEIQQQLSTIGAGGLPVAPKVDRSTRYPGEATGLQAEQQELRQKNQQLEASKRQLANELREKGRRAGIPSGYLRF